MGAQDIFGNAGGSAMGVHGVRSGNNRTANEVLLVLHQFDRKSGSQLGRMHDYVGKVFLPSAGNL